MEKTYLFIIKILAETFHLISVGKTKERSTSRPSAQAQAPGELLLKISNFLGFLWKKHAYSS
jgi:hypothetical protein